MTTTTLVANADTIVAALQPFYGLEMWTTSREYLCALCNNPVKTTQPAAISYGASQYGTWVHVACTTLAKTTVTTDEKARKAQKSKARKRTLDAKLQEKVAKALEEQQTTATTPCTHQEEIDEYEQMMTKAVEVITALREQIASLQKDNDALRANLSTMRAEGSALMTKVQTTTAAERRAAAIQNDSPFTPADQTALDEANLPF